MEHNRTLNHVYLIPVFIFIALIMDGMIMNIFSAHLISNPYTLTPRLLLLVLVIFTFFFPKQPLFMYALLFGLIFDSFYSGILGLYAAGFGTIIYLLKKIHKFIIPTAVMMIIIYIIALTYLEIFIFGLCRDYVSTLRRDTFRSDFTLKHYLVYCAVLSFLQIKSVDE